MPDVKEKEPQPEEEVVEAAKKRASKRRIRDAVILLLALVMEAGIILGFITLRDSGSMKAGGVGAGKGIAITEQSFPEVGKKIGEVIDIGSIEKHIWLSDKGTETQFLEIHIKLQVKYYEKQELADRANGWVSKHIPWIRDKVNELLSSKTYSDLKGSINELALKREIRSEINGKLMQDGVPEELVEEVLYHKYEFKL